MSKGGKQLQLEHLLTSPTGLGLTTATPVQRAICRASDGLPLGELWDSPDVRAAFGGAKPPEVAPATFVILAGIRAAKSLTAAAKAIQMSQNVDLSVPWMSAGDLIRTPVVSLDKDKAAAVYSHVHGNLQAKPALRGLLLGEPTGESIYVRHPSGRPIEISISAMARAGGSLVSRWLAGVIFDEAPRMAGDDESVKGLQQNLTAVQGRILPGCQIWLIGSPWAPFGPVYELVQEHFGKPNENCVVVRASGPAMNPVYWTPERCARLKNKDPKAHRTDVEAEFTDAEEALFSSIEIEAAARRDPLVLPPVKGNHYAAAMDPATRGNAWTLTIVTCDGLGGEGGLMPRYRVALARQWIGSKANPLKPDVVLKEIAEVCASYGIDTTVTDQHSFDALQAIAANYNLTLQTEAITSKNRLDMVKQVAMLVSQGLLELPPDPVLHTDLKQAKKRVTVNGVTLVLPKSGDGRHCDYVPALALAMLFPPDVPDEPEKDVDEDFERALREATRGQGQDYWTQRVLGVS